MSDSPHQDAQIEQTSTTHSSKEDKKKDIIVSIVLTESTTSVLNLDLPRLEELHSESTPPTVCAIKAETNIKETNYCEKCNCKENEEFTKFWFSNAESSNQKKTDCEKVSSEVAYFLNDTIMPESSSSLQVSEAQLKCKEDATCVGSSSNCDQKLKPTKVYTRPLLTVRSIAHQNCIRSQANNILISVTTSSKTNITKSDWINVCRICHGGKSIGDLCAPCRCRGSIALAHLECLERWLKESATSHCELCQHHYQIVRKQKYGVLKSVFMFLQHPGDHFWELLYDVCGFAIYTPAAITSTFMLMLLCESAAKHSMKYERNIAAHIMTFAAVFGLAAIDFTYSAWLMSNLQKHVVAWRNWCRNNNCELRLILSENRNGRHSSSSCSLMTQLD